MRRVWAAAFLLRRWRAERGALLLMVALVGVTSFLAAAGPRLYNRVADAGISDAVADASTAVRNIELTQNLTVPPGTDVGDMVDGTGQTFRELFGRTIDGLIVSQEVAVTSPRFALTEIPRFQTFITLRHQSGIGEAARLVDGRWPKATGERLPLPVFEFGPGPGGEPRPPARVELAVSTETAAEAGLEVGQVFTAEVDGRDPLVPRGLLGPPAARFEIVGIVEVDPDAEIWYSDNRIQRPGADYNADTPQLFVTALIAPDAMADLVASTMPFRYAWHYFIDPTRVDAGRLEALAEEVRQLRTTFSSSSLGPADEERVVVRTSLLPVLEAYVAQRSASEAVLSVAAIGPFALAAGAIGTFAVLLVARRRPSLLLARGRGAPVALVLGAQLWEATVLVGAATIAGILLALAVVPARTSGLSVPLALFMGLVAVLLLVATTWPVVRRPLEPAARDTTPPGRAAPRRLILELTAVGLAVGGVALLQQRGLTIDQPGSGPRAPVQFDPFLAAVPVLVGFAAGIVATRLYPLPVRFLGWVAGHGRGLVAVLGLRGVGRQPSIATLPLLVLMLTAAFGAFALVVMTSIDRGQVEASWRAIGADYRVAAADGDSLAELDPTTLAGVGGVARSFVAPSATLQLGVSRVRIHLEAIDAAAHETVTAGSPLRTAWPAEFLATGSDAGAIPAGTDEQPIPAIVSSVLPGGLPPIAAGSNVRIQLAGRVLTLRVLDVRASMPGIVPGDTFIVGPLAPFLADPSLDIETNVLYVRGGPEIEAELTNLAGREAVGSTVNSRHAWYRDLQETPLVGIVGAGFRLGLVIALAYAALAIVTTLTLTAARRARDVAFLRPLGLSAAQAAGVTIVEHGVPVILAIVPGIATGIAVAVLLESSLGLDAFIGAGLPYRVQLDWPGIVGVGALLALVVAGAVVVSTWLSQRMRVVDALRAGEA